MRKLRPFEALLNSVKSTARNYNHEFTITYEEYIEFTKIPRCHYCKSLINWRPYAEGKSNAYYLDRMDNLKGYHKENCVVCCTRCNWSKGSRFSYEEWVEIGRTIERFRRKQKRNDRRLHKTV